MAGLLLDFAGFGQLVQGGKARFVAHVILTMLHHGDTKRGAFFRNPGADHQLNGRVFENLAGVGNYLGLGESFGKTFQQVKFFGIDRHKLGPGPE